MFEICCKVTIFLRNVQIFIQKKHKNVVIARVHLRI